MSLYLWPTVFALFIWWFSTGAVLYVVGRSKDTFPLSMAVATAAGLVAFVALIITSDDTSVSSAYVGFTSALVLWGWHEMSFLTGYVTGPRNSPLPEGARGPARLWPAIEVLIYHELAIFLTLAAIAWTTWGAPNETGLWTFLILWIMRLSAKLNVYLGVPNLTEEFLPDHLAYLKSYFRRRPINALLPISITASTAATVLLIENVVFAASAFEAASFAFLAALMALALLEHWFLVLPLPAASLWTWGLSSRKLASQQCDRPSRDIGSKLPKVGSTARVIA